MNRGDFQRNFQWSYFGLVGSPKLLYLFKNAGIDGRGGYDLSPNYIYPASQPQINGAETDMLVYVVFPAQDGGFIRKRIHLPWYVDCDEDSTYIQAGVPVTGMIQGRYSAVYVSRLPARDTPRGYCPKFSRSVTVNGALMRSEGLENYNDDVLVWRIYNKQYIPWSTACDNLAQGDLLGAAVDKFLALGVMQGRPNTQIFYKSTGAIGYVEDRTPFVYPDNSTYALREYIRKIAGIMPEVKQP